MTPMVSATIHAAALRHNLSVVRQQAPNSRVMAVVKLRASAHSNELCRFHIDDEGIRFDDPMTAYEGLLSGRPTVRVPAVAPKRAADK